MRFLFSIVTQIKSSLASSSSWGELCNECLHLLSLGSIALSCKACLDLRGLWRVASSFWVNIFCGLSLCLCLLCNLRDDGLALLSALPDQYVPDIPVMIQALTIWGLALQYPGFEPDLGSCLCSVVQQ